MNNELLSQTAIKDHTDAKTTCDTYSYTNSNTNSNTEDQKENVCVGVKPKLNEGAVKLKSNSSHSDCDSHTETFSYSDSHSKLDEVEDQGQGEVDAELEDLLDESLADLTTYTTTAKEKVNVAESGAPPAGTSSHAKAENEKDAFMQALLGGAMGQSDSSAAIEEHLKELLKDDPLAMSEFEKLSNPSTERESQKDFADTLAETLSSLSENAKSLQGQLSEDELVKTLQQSLGLDETPDGPDGDGFMPLMQNMMSSLLSKDILYPSLKDLADKYPSWLSANNGKLPKKQFDVYARQFDIVSRLCDLYHSEKSTDSQQIKDERFEKILNLMTEMQDCGPPPKEIVGEVAPGLNFDASGNPQFPGMEQCSIM